MKNIRWGPIERAFVCQSDGRNAPIKIQFEGALKPHVENGFLKEYYSIWDADELTMQLNGNIDETHKLIEKVIFNPPATIIKWKDETKTVVKVADGQEYEPEIGFAMAMMKKQFGSRSRYSKWIKQWEGD